MDFRVTVGLGQDSADVAVLEDRAAALQDSVASLSEGVGVVVVVDLVKAAVQLVLAVEAEDALDAADQAVGLTVRVLATAALPAPASILTLEAEAIPAPLAGPPVATPPSPQPGKRRLKLSPDPVLGLLPRMARWRA